MKNFDENIRDKVFNSEMDVSDHIWDYIDSQISTKNERSRYWLFFFGSIILLPILFIGTYYVNNNNLSNSESIVVAKDVSQDNILPHAEIALDGLESLIEERLTDDLSPIDKSNKISPLVSQSRKSLNLGFQIASFRKQKKENNNLQVIKNNPTKKFNAFYSPYIAERSASPLDLFAAKTQCPTFQAQGNFSSMYTYVNTSGYYPIMILSSAGDDVGDFIAKRKNSESSLVSFSFDAGLGFDYHENWFVETGLSYNQTNVKFYNRKEDVIKNTLRIVETTLIDNISGDEYTQIDTFIDQEIGVTETASLNTFKQIDIPLHIGYRLPVSRVFDLAVSAGVVVNLKTFSKGYIVDSSGVPYEFTNQANTDNLFKTQVGLSYTGRFNLETEIYPDLYLNGGLNLRYTGGNFNSVSNTVNQRFFNVGLGVGMRYKI